MSNDTVPSEFGCSRITVVLIVAMFLVMAGLSIPAIQQAREAARQTQSRNQLRQIGLALNNYYDTFNRFAPGGVFNQDGVAFHGWTTSIAPYFDASPWYNSVDFNIPWDDPRQVALFRDWLGQQSRNWSNPAVSPVHRPDGLVFNPYAGNQAIFYRNSSVDRFRYGIHAGQLLVADAFDHHVPVGVPTAWRDVKLGLKINPDGFGCEPRDFTQCLMGDGSVRDVANMVNATVIAAMAGSPEYFPKPEEVAKPPDYSLIDISRIWKVEWVRDNDNQFKEHHIRWIPPPGHEGERRY